MVCANLAPNPVELVLGNELLLVRDPDYPHEQRFKVKQHTIEAVCEIVVQLDLPPASFMANAPDGVQSALDVFAGYLMLDAWIANQDRHHENWAALREGATLKLAPTFDHGAALARNLLDKERQERLTTKDRNRTLESFAARGRSALYGCASDPRPLELRETFCAFASRTPNGAARWLDRLRTVKRGSISGILEKVPADRMSEVCKQFTTELLLTNQQRLLEETR